jgi:hypothetical protein
MKTYSLPLALIGLALFILAGILMLKPFYQAEGAAFTGGRTFVQTATTTAVGPQDGEDTIFASDETCNARVISTQGLSAIMIAFSDPVLSAQLAGNLGSTTVSASAGHFQAASTTVVYDAGLYGCGRWTVYAWASSTLTVSEF